MIKCPIMRVYGGFETLKYGYKKEQGVSNENRA